MEAALVLDGHLKSALAAARSLGRQGVSVHCGAGRTSAVACHSRYVAERFVYPSPYTDQAGFIEAVKAAAAACGGRPVVYAFSDATWLTLYQYREELAEVLTFMLPDPQHVDIAFDKGATHSEARILNVPVVKTYIRERREEVEQLGRELEFPAVVKSRHSVTWRSGVGVFGTAVFVENAQELLERFLEIKQQTGEAPLIQPFIGGEEYGVELLVQHGTVVAETVHHRIRSMSPTGGSSVVKGTVEDTELVHSMRGHAYTLARALSWTGPLMVEFKDDSEARHAKLMELNGRWWGSLPLAVRAGVDFPYLYYRLATGAPLPEDVVRARPGVVTRHFLGDARHLLKVFFARDPMRSRLYPRRRKAFKDFFRAFRGTSGDVWAWTDPLPALMEPIDMIKKLVAEK